jgi:hypothetical protein
MEMDEETVAEILTEAVMDTLVLTGLIVHVLKQMFVPALLSKMVVNLADLTDASPDEGTIALERFPNIASVICGMEILNFSQSKSNHCLVFLSSCGY